MVSLKSGIDDELASRADNTRMLLLLVVVVAKGAALTIAARSKAARMRG